MNVLLATIGTAGDVHPFIAVARALAAKGHHPVILTNPYFQDRILSAGVGFWPVGSAAEYQRLVTDPALVTPGRSVEFVYRALMLDPFAEQAEAVREAVRVTRADAALVHHICFGAAAACEQAGLPTALGVLAPMFWLSRSERLKLPVPLVGRLPLRAQLIARKGLRVFSRYRFDPGINRARRKLGLAALPGGVSLSGRAGEALDERTRQRSPGEEDAGGGGWRPVPLGLWSSSFRSAQPDDPRHGRVCGFAVWDRPATSPEQQERHREIARWMDDGPPPVLVTLGSSVSHHGGRLYAAAGEACARLGLRALMLTGASGASRTWAEGVRAIDYAPYSMVMPRALCVVHHAGIGTTAAALRSGKPSIIVPFANDEFDNADRAARLGAAVVIRERRATVSRLARGVQSVRSDDAMLRRCDALREQLSGEDGADAAARAIEELASPGPSSREASRARGR